MLPSHFGLFLPPVPRPSPFIPHLTCPPAVPQASTLLAEVSPLPFNFILEVCEQSEQPQTPCTQCPPPRSPPPGSPDLPKLLHPGRGDARGGGGVSLPLLPRRSPLRPGADSAPASRNRWLRLPSSGHGAVGPGEPGERGYRACLRPSTQLPPF